MSYQVLARKWRPKNFQELVGQHSANQTLTNALKKERLYPVLIFTGPRGTGKTSTARIVAKSLRCRHKTKDFQPCETCQDCLFISNSRHLDVIEIDGASNNGVEAIRELRERAAYMPSTGYWKIYIIDEVHMLSNSAFNALLKTLEEPPKHVVFIMATTESHKIPPTVLSRCQKIDFHLLSAPVIKNQLEKICHKENFQVSENILWMIAKQSQGSLRDAQSLLDQVITFCGENSKEIEVRRLLGLSDPQILETCLKALLAQEEQKMIHLIADLRSKSVSPKVFLQNLLASLSQLLFLKKNPNNNPPLLHCPQEEINRKKKLISSISYEQLHFLFDMLLKGEREITLCYDSELVLEVLLLRLCSAPQIETLAPFYFIKKPPAKEILSKNVFSHNITSTQQKDTKPLSLNTVSAQQKDTKPLSFNTASTQQKDTNSHNITSTQQKDTDSPPHNTASAQQKDTNSHNITSTQQKDTDSPPHNTASAQQKDTNSHNITSTQQKDTDSPPHNTASAQQKDTNSHNITSTQQKDTDSPPHNTASAQQKDTNSHNTASNTHLKPFAKRFDFLSHLKQKDTLLSTLIENLSFKQRTESEFVFLIPKNFSYLKKKLETSSIQRQLEQELSSFLNIKKKAKLEYRFESRPETTLKQEQEEREEKKQIKQAQQNSLVQQINHIFKGEIKSIKRIDKKNKGF